jgi:hypothetical protein
VFPSDSVFEHQIQVAAGSFREALRQSSLSKIRRGSGCHQSKISESVKKMVTQARFERATPGFGGCGSHAQRIGNAQSLLLLL